MKYLFAVVMLMFVSLIAAGAQDATRAPFVRASDTPSITSIYTAEPTNTPVPTATDASPAGSVVNVYQAPVTPAATETPAAPEPWFAKYIAIIAVILGGFAALIRWINVRAEAIKVDKAKMTVGEQVYGHFVPAAIKNLMLGLALEVKRLGGNAEDILVELGDDKPIALK